VAFELGLKKSEGSRVLTHFLAEFRGVDAVSSLCGADADEDVGVPVEEFSPCLGVSVRGLPRR
jgi:hypothetical protein